ncbi:MAG: phenylalanine--tRNA ligase subunit beta [Thermoplasmata archaeon]|nr:phenylalanine--tRNA ligase subunit beta [Thermoplasmata archaeon]
MPVITFDYTDLVSLLGGDPGRETVAETLAAIGSSVEKMGDEVEVEFFPNRPDLYSVEGVARALRCYLGMGEPREYETTASGYTLTIENTVKDIRPHMVAAVVRNVVFDDPFIQSIMQVQEKLHKTLGRNRKKVAIGIHDLSRVTPPFHYRGAPPDTSFPPLGYSYPMTMEEILERHEKGREYAHLVKGHSLYPLFVDSEDQVLSFPPIINGTLTTVTEDTTDLLLDVTGEHLPAMEYVLNILCCLFIERGARVETVEIMDGEEKRATPDLSYRPMKISPGDINAILGTSLSKEDMAGLLRKMGHKTAATPEGLEVLVPPYRADILHPIDIAEDIAAGYGYMKMAPTLPREFTPGNMREATRTHQKLGALMQGLGFLEVMTFTLIGREDQYTKMRLPVEEVAPLVNPLTQEHNSLREWLIPSLMQILKANRHRDLPQKIYEIDDVIIRGENHTHLGAAIASTKTGFTEIKGHVETIMQALGMEWTTTPKDHPSFIPGRCATITHQDTEIGFYGELHPEVITNHELTYPVTALEIYLDKIQ